MARSGQFYMRLMDDILVLAPTRWRLRTAVKAANEVFGSLCLLKHPDKTFIGRIVARAIRLYEQGPGGIGLRPAWIVRAALGRVGGGGA